MSFTPEQTKELSKKLDPAHIKPPKKFGPKGNYIEGWHAIAEANRIFGFGEWSDQIKECRCVSENQRKIGNPPKDGWGVTYVIIVRVDVAGVVREDVGAGHGFDVDLGQAHESAIKEAATDALKRSLRTFGNPFGLALYDKTHANIGVDKPSDEDQRKEFEQKWIADRKPGKRLPVEDSAMLFTVLKTGFEQCADLDDFTDYSAANHEEISTLVDPDYVALIWVSKETKQRVSERQEQAA